MVEGIIAPDASPPLFGVEMDTLPNSKAFACENVSEVNYLSQKTGRSFHTFRNPGNVLNGRPGFVEDRGLLCQGFSIREYVGKIRSVNFRKCWPFSESFMEEGSREHLLPPLNRPCYRWWACQHCEGEHEHIGTSFQQEPENYTRKTDRIIDREMTVPPGDMEPCISQDLEEQIRKLSRVQISGDDDNTVKTEDGIRGVENKDERRNVSGYRQRSLGPPYFRASSSNTGSLKANSHPTREEKPARLHKNGQADTYLPYAPANVNQNGKPDTAISKTFVKQSLRGRSCTLDLMEREYEIFKDESIREETEKARKTTQVTQDQVTAGSVSNQIESNTIDNLNSQASKSESIRNGISNISNGEVCAVKVCPVCKTFTSTTITAVNAHIDDCLLEASKAEKKQGKMQKHKSRRQKKRSIVDIFSVAPPAHCHLDHPENLGMSESEGSAAPNCKLMKKVAPIHTGFGNIICDDLPSFNCKRKRATQSNSLIQNGKAGNVKAESLEKKRKRRHLRISKGVKELKMPAAATLSANTDHGAEHHLKQSSTEEDSSDSKVEKPPTVEAIPMQKCDITNNQHQQSCNVMGHTQSESMLPTEDRAKEDIIFNNSTEEEQSGMIVGDEIPGDPSSNLTMENASIGVSQSYVMSDTAHLSTELSHSHNEKSYLLGDNECRTRKAYSTDRSRLQVQETSKPEDVNLQNFLSENPVYKKVTSLYHGNAGEPEQSNGIYEESECSVMYSLDEGCPLVQTNISDKKTEPVNYGFEFVVQTEGKNARQANAKHKLGDVSSSSCIQSFEWEKENSKVLHSLQNVRHIRETGKVMVSHFKNARLDLNRKASFFPRDSKGRFLSSQSMDGSKQGDLLCPKWKQTARRRSTKPPKSLINTFAMKEETNHVEARPSENTMELVKFSIHGNPSDYGCIGLPLDSQGELVKHIPNTRPGFNQLYKIPNYTVVNEPFVSQDTKTHREFNFVESTKLCYDAVSAKQPLQIDSFKCSPQQNYSVQCKQPDHRQEYSVSKTNQSNPDKRGPEHSSILDQNQRDKMHRGSSHIRIASSSIGAPETMPMLCMQATVQSEYNEDQSKKPSVLGKTYPQVDIKKYKQSTTQPVMRLMGQSFTIGGEHEGRHDLKHPLQCNTKDDISTMVTTKCVPSTTQRMTSYIHRCIACNKAQYDLPWPGGNALCQHCRGNAIISKSIQHNFKDAQNQEMSSIESSVSHEDRTLNNNAPKLVEKRLPTNNVLHGHSLKDQSYSGQAWTSSPPFSAPIATMLISPVRDFCNNTCLNEGHKMQYNNSHVCNQGCPVQKQTYSQLLNSCLEKQTFQNPDYNGWTYTNNTCSPPIHSDVVQSLSCPISSLRPLADPLPSFTFAFPHSTSLPTEKQSHCQPPLSYTSIADSPALLMPGKCIYPSINLAEGEKLIHNLPQNMATNGCEFMHQKLGVTDAVDIDRKCRDDSRKRETVKDTKGLLGKWISAKHKDCGAGPMQRSTPFSTAKELHKQKKVIHQEICSSTVATKHAKRREIIENNMLDARHGEICRTNNSWIEFSMDGGNSSNQKLENEYILNACPYSGFSKKFPERESGLPLGPNTKYLETEIRTSTIGLHNKNAGSSLKLAEPMKLSGGAKHVLKPSSQNGNGLYLPIHYTLPFAETAAEERERNWKA